jgi:Spy/CpxP family protein refolding chaperone
MMMNRHRGIHSAALALLPMVALAGAVQANPAASDQAAPTATASPDGSANWHRHGPPMGEFGSPGGMMKVLRDLNLTDAQKGQIHTIFSGMHTQMETDRQSELADLPAFGNPGDPQYAAAVQAAQRRASARIQRWSEAQQQAYAVLTQPQQAQLPQLLAAMQRRMAAHRQHGAPASPSN